MRSSFPCLKALVVFSNQPTPGFWTSITYCPRPFLVCVCVNNFLLQDVSLENISALKFLWLSRPTKKRGHAAFLRQVCDHLRELVYLSTIDFKGFSRKIELDAWLRCLGGEALPSLRYWEVHESDVTDILTLTQHLTTRRTSLTIQGLCMKESCILVDPFHKMLSGSREVSLHIPRIYRSLGILGHVIHTRIPTPSGFTYLRGRDL